MVKWTEAQKDAITYNNNKNILVAAAAGSGKTAVLVERVIRKILDTENPVSIDELLVLTFTDAAAKEMKNKIETAIEKALSEHPDNAHLKKQALRAGSADILTIDAFAKKVIQNNIHLTDIPAGFTIIDAAENKFLLDEALDLCMERYYMNIDRIPAFGDLAAGYGGIKNDDKLRNEILRLYNFAMSMAQPEKWLCRMTEMYREVAQRGTVADTEWGEIYLSCIKDRTRFLLGYYNVINDILEKNYISDDEITVFFKNEEKMFRHVLSLNSLDEYFDYAPKIRFMQRPSLTSDDEILAAAGKIIGKTRDAAKDEFNKTSFMRYSSAEEAAELIIKVYPRIKTLKNITLMLMRKHKKLKRKNSFLDFSDLEHELIGLLMNHDGTPTEFCTELGSKYKEILVDEYQDTNNIQDRIFSLLSGGRGNLFMVGDLKQSIYGFRNSSPELFLSKYRLYGSDADKGHLIRLSNNFRSRSTVVDTVNFVFRQIMHENVAEMEYTKDEYLNQSAVYEDSDNTDIYNTEMLLTDVKSRSAAETELGIPRRNKYELEAEAIAKRIIELIYKDKIAVTDKSGERRPAKFGDIVILCRSPKSAVPYFEEVFDKYGIGLNTELRTGFLDSVEVRTVLSFLEIIDNPLRDIPLVAVMRSPMFGFTADELAKIRTAAHGRFYDAVTAAAEHGDNKAADFVTTLNELRLKSEYMGVDELIHIICRDLSYESAAAAMPGGDLRLANLRLLSDRATSFERTGFKGLFNFINYLERVSNSKNDLAAGKADAGDSVTLMSIHKSKGLEYPIVILAGTCSGGSNKTAFKYNSRCIGMNYVDVKTRIKYSCPTMELTEYLCGKEETAEEMRILYVALTRAREKLIISCTNEGVSKRWLSPYIMKNGEIAPVMVEETNAFRNWLIYAFLTHKDGEGLRDMMETDLTELVPSSDGGQFSFTRICSVRADDNNNTDAEREGDTASEETQNAVNADPSVSEITNKAEEILGYRYPHKVFTEIPLKLTVTEIKEHLISLDDEGYTPRHSSIADRSFKEAVRSKAAESGTVTHFVLEHIDPSHTDTAEAVCEEIIKMTANGMLTEAQAAEADPDPIARLFASELGARIRAAAALGDLHREFKFLIPVEADSIYKSLNPGGTIIVQGIVDCFFFENDEIVLVDYKTDNCSRGSETAAAEKYRIQAELYARGLEMIFGARVKEKIIFFLKPQTAVTL